MTKFYAERERRPKIEKTIDFYMNKYKESTLIASNQLFVNLSVPKN